MVTSIYVQDPKLKEDAEILARLMGQSFSKLVWEVLRSKVEENRDEINQMRMCSDRINLVAKG